MRSSLLLSAPVRVRLWRGCQVPDLGHALDLEHGPGHCIPALQAGLSLSVNLAATTDDFTPTCVK
jgi:hypothetical protein